MDTAYSALPGAFEAASDALIAGDGLIFVEEGVLKMLGDFVIVCTHKLAGNPFAAFPDRILENQY
jgi:hypothetical protein